ncbi:MAG: MgtC/SapB family protein [Clostridia bacterium]|nr:MgtC/SapB family protein [Clostridia bacterium]
MEKIIQELWLGLDLCLAALLGFIIGFERKLRYKEAGIRTHTVVSIGACLITIISKYAFKGDYDSSRVASQIVSGVGFLGAGMIVYRKNAVSGLTTAAGVWTTAGVGMACGGGLYVVAVCATVIIVALQCLFHLNWKVFNRKKYYTVKISFGEYENGSDLIKEIFEVERFTNFVISNSEDKIFYKVKLNTSIEITEEKIREIISKHPFIYLIELTDSE